MDGISISGLVSESWWIVGPSISAVTLFIAGLINNKFGISGVWQQVCAWACASTLSVLSWIFGIVSVGEPTWLSVIVLCFFTGLASNGIYDFPAIKKWIDNLPFFGKAKA
jgi:hypothetical protein